MELLPTLADLDPGAIMSAAGLAGVIVVAAFAVLAAMLVAASMRR